MPTRLINIADVSAIGVLQPYREAIVLGGKHTCDTTLNPIYLMTTEQQCQHTVRTTVGDAT
jgi:hypothetical protein